MTPTKTSKRSIILVAATGLLLCLIFVLRFFADRPHFRELRFQSNLVILGNLEGLGNPTASYFSLECEDLGSSCNPAEPLILHLSGRSVPIADVTLSAMPTIGASEVTAAGGSAGNLRTFVVSQNINGEVTFEFEGSRLKAFYANCDQEEGCDFQISFGERPSFSFPILESELLARAPKAEQVNDSWGL